MFGIGRITKLFNWGYILKLLCYGALLILFFSFYNDYFMQGTAYQKSLYMIAMSIVASIMAWVIMKGIVKRK